MNKYEKIIYGQILRESKECEHKNAESFKPCPFCGSKPIFPEAKDVIGTYYDGGCEDCNRAYISLQIIDSFDYPRDHVRKSWDEQKKQYGVEFIEVVRKEAIKIWETRHE